MDFQVISESDWRWRFLRFKRQFLPFLIVLLLLVKGGKQNLSECFCLLVFVSLSETEHMVWDGVISFGGNKALDIFQFHELLFKFLGFFAFQAKLLDKTGFFLGLHDNLVVGRVLMRIFEVMFNDVLYFLSFLVIRTLLHFLIPWLGKSLRLQL